jgi:hypothetical protein
MVRLLYAIGIPGENLKWQFVWCQLFDFGLGWKEASYLQMWNLDYTISLAL